MRDAIAGYKDKIPALVLYSLPDGIWVYSATSLMFIIWKGNWEHIMALPWILIPLFLSIGVELLQFVHVVEGSFCLYDMAFYLIGFSLPVIMFRRRYENQQYII